MKTHLPLLCLASILLAADTPSPLPEATTAGGPTVTVKLPAAPRDYLWTMIACDEKEERYIEFLYDAFLRAADSKQLGKDQFRVPAHFAERIGPNYIFERAYYITQNNLKGFSLAIPADCMTAKDGMLSPSCDLVVVDRDTKQGLRLFTLKRKEPNQTLEPTAPSGRGSS